MVTTHHQAPEHQEAKYVARSIFFLQNLTYSEGCNAYYMLPLHAVASHVAMRV